MPTSQTGVRRLKKRVHECWSWVEKYSQSGATQERFGNRKELKGPSNITLERTGSKKTWGHSEESRDNRSHQRLWVWNRQNAIDHHSQRQNGRHSHSRQPQRKSKGSSLDPRLRIINQPPYSREEQTPRLNRSLRSWQLRLDQIESSHHRGSLEGKSQPSWLALWEFSGAGEVQKWVGEFGER